MDGAAAELSKIVREGPFTDIFLALQARNVFQVLGQHADRVNSSSFAPAFGMFQSQASDAFILAITRLLEREREHYPLQSVHGALCFLARNAAKIPVSEPVFLEQSMQRMGYAEIPSSDLERQTHAVVEILISRLPHHSENRALEVLKTLRDKRIAHPERVKVESLPATTWQDAESLLKIPTEALAILGGYTSDAYVDSTGRLLMETDAKVASIATVRLMREVGIVSESSAQSGR
jgi:hypothetical protein